MQLVTTDVTGKDFPTLARELVFDPIGMKASSFEQKIPPRADASAAHKLDGSMVPGRTHVYPEMAAAGLWTNPTELLQWAIAIAESRAGSPNSVLSLKMATEMLTPQKASSGLGPFLGGSGRAFSFGHVGGDEGFHAQVVYFPETGQGAAVMVNGDGGTPIMQELLFAIAAEYGWPEYGPREVETVAMDTTRMDRAVGAYSTTMPIPITVTVTREGTRMFVESHFNVRSEAVFTAPDRLLVLDAGLQLTLAADPSGRIISVATGPIRATRVP
jgi:CubicO group peptidase (beta-lactamase class C family)